MRSLKVFKKDKYERLDKLNDLGYLSKKLCMGMLPFYYIFFF